jgi:hypothetical protein
MKRFTLVGTLVAAALAFSAPQAGAAFTAHSKTSTVSCGGGTGFVVDGNAYFGQLTETAAWNAGDHGTTCGVSPPA